MGTMTEYLKKRVLHFEDLQIKYTALGNSTKASEMCAIKDELLDALIFEGISNMDKIGEQLK